ncbi:hypothetical protein NE237_023631 [Protea cynaroides]|uniref:TF-B3 domain-containing protein n=1 Tax=Protea cynaroides TaxID=273540 RepID=A0A9Q0K5K7_9MAGN|nr:hypothetical protein NE237_023631 [Protea cynaroides]
METTSNGRWKKPLFFKPMLPPFHQLSIPRAFLKHLVDELSEEGDGEATLRNNRCDWKFWHVKIKGFCFTEGWADFVADNDIRIGYFVVFSYEGAMVFNVRIFNLCACEKEYSYPQPLVAIPMEAQKQENNDREETEEEIKITPPRGCNRPKATKPCSFKILMRHYNLRKDFVAIPMVFARYYGLTINIFKAILRDEKMRMWSVNLDRCRNGRVILLDGWHEFVSANQLKEGDSCLFKLNNSGANAIVLDVTVFSSSSKRRVPVKNNEQAEIKPSAVPRNPSFVTSLKPFNLKESRLNVPMNFARLNGLMGKQYGMILTDRKGRSWKVQLKHRKRKGTVSIYGDWVDISAANVLKDGDTFILELVQREKMPVMGFRLL